MHCVMLLGNPPLCEDRPEWVGPPGTIGEIICPPSPLDTGYPIGHTCAYVCPPGKFGQSKWMQ